MELELALIRHGQTENFADRLIGMTDEPLSGEGEAEIRQKAEAEAYPKADVVYSSGLTRCMETARIIYPTGIVVAENDLQAPNYGDFDGKSYSELEKDDTFALWKSSSGLQSFPNGEDYYKVAARSTAAFYRICSNMASNGFERVSIVTHKAVILAILQRYCTPRMSYTICDISHGEGYLISYDALNCTAKIKYKL